MSDRQYFSHEIGNFPIEVLDDNQIDFEERVKRDLSRIHGNNTLLTHFKMPHDMEKVFGLFESAVQELNNKLLPLMFEDSSTLTKWFGNALLVSEFLICLQNALIEKKITMITKTSDLIECIRYLRIQRSHYFSKDHRLFVSVNISPIFYE